MRLLQRLPASVVRRVHRERYANPSWITPVPASQRLTDADLQDFTHSLLGAALLAMFRYCRLIIITGRQNQAVRSRSPWRQAARARNQPLVLDVQGC